MRQRLLNNGEKIAEVERKKIVVSFEAIARMAGLTEINESPEYSYTSGTEWHSDNGSAQLPFQDWIYASHA